MICVLDIGSSKLKILAAEKNKDENLELVFKGEKDAEGTRRGIIINEEKISYILKLLLQQVIRETGKKISSVYVSVNGSHLFLTPSKGLISVSRADQKISEEDVQRVIQAAQSVNLPSNREIFETFIIDFIIDNQFRTKEPIGLEGVRLEAEALILAGFAPYLERQKKTILNAGLEILDLIPAPLAAARAVLSTKQKELGSAVIDIGAGTTSLAVFEEDTLIHLAILPVGSSNITNDIAIGLKVDTDIAELIKQEQGNCILKGKDVKIKINLEEEKSFVFSKKFLVKIISERVSEIFNQINLELKKIGKEKMLPGGIVLCGGGSKLVNIVDFAKDKFRLPVRLGRPKGVFGIEEDPAWAVACGLVLLGYDIQKEGGTNFHQKLINKIKNFLKIFIP